MDHPGLTWVIIDGSPAHVSRFAALRPARRPRATCPKCARRLVLKLGRVRRHHAAHAPGAVCSATQPETALHLDAKFHIAAQLEQARDAGAPLTILRRCAGAGGSTDCDRVNEHEWLAEWDAVSVETRLVSKRTRPDILLLRNGAPVGAIEVRVTHAVDEPKSAVLAQAKLPWIEVRASHALIDGTSAWRHGAPLPVSRASESDSADGEWRCPRHRDLHCHSVAARQASIEAELDAASRTTVLRAARVVDFYSPDGHREREIYRVDEVAVLGGRTSLALLRGKRQVAEHPAGDSRDSRRAAWQALRRAFDADIGVRTHAPGMFADSPMRWATRDAAENIVLEALYDMQPRDPTPLATTYPRRWFWARERGAWFVPREMRDVRWDRPAADAFAAHPAWTASRRVVRERPAPEGGWTSFVFAARPASVSFGTRMKARGRVAGAVEASNGIVVLGASGDAAPSRVLCVVTAPVTDAEVRRVFDELTRDRVEQLWLSHPRDWSASLGDVPWAPAGRDNRGIGVVVVDGLGVYRAERFADAFIRGDRRLSPRVIQRANAARARSIGDRR